MANQIALLATIWSLWGLAFIATVISAISRLRTQGRFQAEDYFSFLAFLFLSGQTSVITAMAPLFGIVQEYRKELMVDPMTPPPYIDDTMVERVVLELKLMFSHMLLFVSTIWASKLSLLVFFRQLVVGLPRYMMAWWLVVAIVLLSYLGCVLSNFLICVPLNKYWSAMGCSDPGNLHRSDASIKAVTALDVSTDILIMLLPLRLLLTLRISTPQKLGLACLFSLGLAAIAFAFVRFQTTTKATEDAMIDPTMFASSQIILSLWSQIEAAVSVIAANLPALRSFLRRQLEGESNFLPKYVNEDSDGTHESISKMYQAHYTGQVVLNSTSQSAIRHQSLELSSLDGNEDEQWPITGKAAELLGCSDGIEVKEAGEDGILRRTEIRVTRSPRTDHKREDSSNTIFGLQLRPDLA